MLKNLWHQPHRIAFLASRSLFCVSASFRTPIRCRFLRSVSKFTLIPICDRRSTISLSERLDDSLIRFSACSVHMAQSLRMLSVRQYCQFGHNARIDTFLQHPVANATSWITHPLCYCLFFPKRR